MALAIVGVTCRTDAVELLEKRVKSRFSQTQLLISPLSSIDTVGALLKRYLLLPANFEDKTFHSSWNKSIEVRLVYYNVL